MTKLAAIVGSNYSKSTNRKLLEYIQSQFFFKVDVDIIEIDKVPFFDLHAEYTMPDIIKEINEKIEKSDGVIIASPEYDHTPTASLLNIISWLSYKIHPLSGKAVLLVGASYGVLGSSRAQAVLRQVLASPEVDAQVFPKGFLLPYSMKAFDDWGDLRGREKIQELENTFDEFLKFVEIINDSREKNLISIHEFDNFKWDKLDLEDRWNF